MNAMHDITREVDGFVKTVYHLIGSVNAFKHILWDRTSMVLLCMVGIQFWVVIMHSIEVQTNCSSSNV